jgi:uncharacterized coiled-coil DUF342 family protein
MDYKKYDSNEKVIDLDKIIDVSKKLGKIIAVNDTETEADIKRKELIDKLPEMKEARDKLLEKIKGIQPLLEKFQGYTDKFNEYNKSVNSKTLPNDDVN